MTVTVKLITEQTTNQLVDSVNAAQTMGWFPVCGVVCFNARYTQLVAQDTERTEPPKCDYFIVDAEDGLSFAQRVNQLLEISPGAVCLSSVQYVQTRYIQSYGDDSLCNGGGDDSLKWYTENVDETYPIIDVDPNLSQIGLGNKDGGYVQLQFLTGGNDAGYIHADDGEIRLYKGNNTQLILRNDDADLIVNDNSVLNSDGSYTNINAGTTTLQLNGATGAILTAPDYEPSANNSVVTKFYVDDNRPVSAVFRASFTTTGLALNQYVTANNTPQVVVFNAQALPNAALGTLDNAAGIFTAARRIVGTLAITCQVRRTTGGAAAVTWGFQVETSPDGVTWTPTAGSARYINLRGAGDNNVLQVIGLTSAVDIPSGTRIRITQMTDTSSANVGLVALPAMLGGATAAGMVFSLITTL